MHICKSDNDSKEKIRYNQLVIIEKKWETKMGQNETTTNELLLRIKEKYKKMAQPFGRTGCT